MSDALYNADVNLWLLASVLMFLKLYLPGLAWSWLIPVDTSGRVSTFIQKTALSILIGVLIMVTSNLVLLELGLFSFMLEIIVLLLAGGAGLLFSFVKDRQRFVMHLKQNIAGSILFLTAVAFIMLMPRASEWMMGGLDPGVYQTQGINISRAGTFYPEAEEFYSEISPDELNLFTRGDGNYREFMPGIPISVESRRVEHYFFRLTPVFVASLDSCGGLRAATRGNYFAAFFTIVVFWGLLSAGGAGGIFQFFAVLFLAVHPIFLYQLHVPTTEMLQLLLISGMGMFLSMRKEGLAPLFVLAFLFFAAVVNRISFFPFGALLICCAAWFDIERDDRLHAVLEKLCMGVGLAAGMVFDYARCAITLERLTDVLPAMLHVGSFLLVAAALLSLLSFTVKFRSVIGSVPRLVYRLMLAAVVFIFALFWYAGHKFGFSAAGRNLHEMMPYLGVVFAVAAFLGGILLFWEKRSEHAALKCMLLFMTGVTMIVVYKSFIEGNYPWAVRRFLPYTVPLIALTCSYLITFAAGFSGYSRKFSLALSCAAVVVILSSTERMSRHARKCAEYQGLSNVLSELSEKIDDNDIVVVDTPQWGMPVKFVYGRNIVNGKHLWRRKSKEGMRDALKTLANMRSKGKRIRFWTTTRTAAMDIYPLKPAGLTLDYETKEISLRKVIHSRNGDDFKMQDTHNVFRLYTWTGSVPEVRDQKSEVSSQ